MEGIMYSLSVVVCFVAIYLSIISMKWWAFDTWRYEKPNGKAKIICAKLIGFGKDKRTYEVLYWDEKRNLWYDCLGEEIPYGMIDKWLLIAK